jgi:hypothetical protein
LKPSRRDGRASRPEAGRKGEKDGYFDELCRFFFTFSSKFSSSKITLHFVILLFLLMILMTRGRYSPSKVIPRWKCKLVNGP